MPCFGAARMIIMIPERGVQGTEEENTDQQTKSGHLSGCLAAFIAGSAAAGHFIAQSADEAQEPVAEVGAVQSYRLYPRGHQERPDRTEDQIYRHHETGNPGRNADAESHNNYLHEEADSQQKSWHYTVDGHEIYYHIPDNEIAFMQATD